MKGVLHIASTIHSFYYKTFLIFLLKKHTRCPKIIREIRTEFSHNKKKNKTLYSFAI